MIRPPHLTGRDAEPKLTVGEVARLFRVDGRTVARWSRNGRLPPAIRTLGGHRRWYESDIRALLQQQDSAAPDGGTP